MIIDVGGHIAKIVDDHDDSVTVNFLQKRSKSTFCFSPERETISKGDISSYLAERLEDTGSFLKEKDHYVEYHESDDDDYVYSDSAESDSEDESLVDETETDIEDEPQM
jgi:hypothetical protein